MFFQALILIAACLGEHIFVPVEANAEGESIVYVKQGVDADGCLASIMKPCPTVDLALGEIDDTKAKFIINILKAEDNYVFTQTTTDVTGKTFLIQGAKDEEVSEIVTVEFPTTLTSFGLSYVSETELKSLKFLCPAGFGNPNVYLITSDTPSVGITLNTVTFEIKAAEPGANDVTSPCRLMSLSGKVSMNNVVIKSTEPWIVKEGVLIGTNQPCTVKGLHVTNVNTPDSLNAVVAIQTTKALTIEDCSFINCSANASENAGALGIKSTDEDEIITFKTTSFTGCTADVGLAGALAVSHAGAEAKLVFTGADALAFTDCKKGTGDGVVATAAVFEFLDETTADLENLALKIKESFGKNYNNVAHKNLIIGRIGSEGDKVDLSKFFPDPPKDDPKEDTAFGVKVNFALFLVALVSVFAAFL